MSIYKITGLGLAPLILGAWATTVHPANLDRPEKVPRYSVVSKYMSIGTLVIYVFTKEGNIEEKKLRRLMRHFFQRYSKPENLDIHLYTHQSQLRDLGTIEVITPNDEAERHPKATIVRLDGKQEINIKLPGRDWLTIIVKEKRKSEK